MLFDATVVRTFDITYQGLGCLLFQPHMRLSAKLLASVKPCPENKKITLTSMKLVKVIQYFTLAFSATRLKGIAAVKQVQGYC